MCNLALCSYTDVCFFFNLEVYVLLSVSVHFQFYFKYTYVSPSPSCKINWSLVRSASFSSSCWICHWRKEPWVTLLWFFICDCEWKILGEDDDAMPNICGWEQGAKRESELENVAMVWVLRLRLGRVEGCGPRSCTVTVPVKRVARWSRLVMNSGSAGFSSYAWTSFCRD